MKDKALAYYLTKLLEEKPQPTEQQILKKFEELGYKHIEFKPTMNYLTLYNPDTEEIIGISLDDKTYCCSYKGGHCCKLSLQEHQLLHELFKCWGWFDE